MTDGLKKRSRCEAKLTLVTAWLSKKIESVCSEVKPTAA